jgi:hypothetical protein
MTVKIKEDGLYDIPMETYHSDCCEGPSISGSGLVKIEKTSLAHYWWNSYHNPKREPMDTTALSFGRAAHAWILGEPEFNKYFIISPYDEFRTKEARAWRDEQTRTIVKAAQFEAIKAMHKTVFNTPLIKNAFTNGRPEMSLIWKDKETGIWLKARPDWLPDNIQFIPNFKTTRSARPQDFQRQAFDLGYHQGAALTIEGLRQIFKWEAPSYYFVAQEKEPPYVAGLFIMRDTDIEWGMLQNRRALRRLADALDKGEWPGYSNGAVEISMPQWTEKLLMDQHEKGDFQDPSETQPE